MSGLLDELIDQKNDLIEKRMLIYEEIKLIDMQIKAIKDSYKDEAYGQRIQIYYDIGHIVEERKANGETYKDIQSNLALSNHKFSRARFTFRRVNMMPDMYKEKYGVKTKPPKTKVDR